MKTFKEFITECDDLLEMRKEDKVKGRKKTPLYLERKRTSIDKAPEGSGKRWNVTTHRDKVMNPEASMGRFKHNPTTPAAVQGGGHGGAGFGYGPQAHGTGGKLRGVKKKDQPKPREPKLNPYQRRIQVHISKQHRTNPDNHIIPGTYSIGGAAAKAKAERAKKSFGKASSDWSAKEKANKSPKKTSAKSRMAAAAEKLGLKD